MKCYEILDIHPSDAYYSDKDELIGSSFFAHDNSIQTSHMKEGWVTTVSRVTSLDSDVDINGEYYYFAIKVKEL